MTRIAYYEADTTEFLSTENDTVLGALARQHGFSLDPLQKHAWQSQIQLLQRYIPASLAARIYFEFSIPRMGKRADIVILARGLVFVVEFKVGAKTFDRSAIEQVYDYALDLKNFHLGSHDLPIAPVLIATEAPSRPLDEIKWARDKVAEPVCIAPIDLPHAIDSIVKLVETKEVDPIAWSRSGYQPTPTIIEAALALYRQHDVKEITRSEAGSDNLGLTARRVEQIIESAKAGNHKAICFITGVPGAGKTLAGLNIATSRAEQHSDEHAVFLSGNGPLVEVLREALARDKSEREGLSRKNAYREVAAFVQNIHHFRDEALNNTNPPVEKVVIFDEAQRAWDRDMATKFMRQKRGYDDFNMSEPAFLLSVMNRHTDWCVVICLVGGGQEINTGEAGLAEWITVLRNHHPDWKLYISNRLHDRDYVWDEGLDHDLSKLCTSKEDSLHLAVSIRSFRAEALSEFVGYVVDNNPEKARETYKAIAKKYPILLTRNIEQARAWLRDNARGSERFGLIASSGANRLRPDGIWIKSKIDAPVWFLNDKADVRSSFYLEEAASEFDVQGLELDWTCVCWDADFRRTNDQWHYFNFRGTRWQRVSAKERQLYLKNAYRVLLTRARQGMVVFVPLGDVSDATRDPSAYDQIFDYLRLCGIPSA